MIKQCLRVLLLPIFLLFAGLANAMPFPSVQNLFIEDNTLSWDAVANAGGYNIYYLPGGPSKNATVEYFTTVKNATSLSDIQPGVYSVIAFSEDETQFSESSSAPFIWLRPDGVVDNPDGPDGPGDTISTTITFYGNNNDRYLVETECTDEVGICTANCNYEGNAGYITGGFCSASDSHLNSSGYIDHYQCYAPNGAAVMTAGAYCSK